MPKCDHIWGIDYIWVSILRWSGVEYHDLRAAGEDKYHHGISFSYCPLCGENIEDLRSKLCPVADQGLR